MQINTSGTGRIRWVDYWSQIVRRERVALVEQVRLEYVASSAGGEKSLYGSVDTYRRPFTQLIARITNIGLTIGKVDTMEGAPQIERDERLLVEFGMQFLRASETGDVGTMERYISAGYPVNFQHPTTKLTALHNACALTLREAVRTLVNSGKCQYLLQDENGRLPYDLANRLGQDRAIERLMLRKSLQEADARGIDFYGTFYRRGAKAHVPSPQKG